MLGQFYSQRRPARRGCFSTLRCISCGFSLTLSRFGLSTANQLPMGCIEATGLKTRHAELAGVPPENLASFDVKSQLQRRKL